MERTALETGDLCLATHPFGAIVERKTPGDLASCVGSGRERFERELQRGRYVGRMVVVVEGSLSDVVVAARGIHHNAVVGTLAAWTLRYAPFVFAGSEQLAADFSWRFLAAQLPSAERRKTRTASNIMQNPDPPPPNGDGARQGAASPLSISSPPDCLLLAQESSALRLAYCALDAEELAEFLQLEHARVLGHS